MLFLDSSALVKRYSWEPHSEWVHEVMTGDTGWSGSALLATETAIGIARCEPNAAELAAIDVKLNRDLEFFDLVPVDAECLVRAVDIGRGYGVRSLDAIHLAATSAIPEQFSFVTFDDRQRDAAEAIGLNVLRPPV
jgi:predicted nucleic acid-binding protein